LLLASGNGSKHYSRHRGPTVWLFPNHIWNKCILALCIQKCRYNWHNAEDTIITCQKHVVMIFQLYANLSLVNRLWIIRNRRSGVIPIVTTRNGVHRMFDSVWLAWCSLKYFKQWRTHTHIISKSLSPTPHTYLCHFFKAYWPQRPARHSDSPHAFILLAKLVEKYIAITSFINIFDLCILEEAVRDRKMTHIWTFPSAFYLLQKAIVERVFNY